MIERLAWRNIGRHRRRTLITLSSVVFGVWLTATSSGMGNYMYRRMIDDSARMGFGHVTVEPLGFDLAPSLEKRIRGTEAIAKEVERIPDVEATAVRTP